MNTPRRITLDNLDAEIERIKSAAALDEIAAALFSEWPGLRVAAAETCGRRGKSDALPFLIASLEQMCFGNGDIPGVAVSSRMTIAFADAFAKIAENDSAPELRDALPALQFLKMAWDMVAPRPLSACQSAIRQIQTAIGADLPLPAQSSDPDASNLPRPAASVAAVPDSKSLPIPFWQRWWKPPR